MRTHPSSRLSPSLTEALRATAAEAERLGQLHPTQYEILLRERWCQSLVARAYGGMEQSLPEVLRLQEAIAWAEGSTAWVATLCSGAGWFSGFMDPDLARQLFADPSACVAGSGAVGGVAREEGGGYRISGRWLHASGIRHATVLTGNCYIGATPEHGREALIKPFVFLREEVQVHPHWPMMGMVATGSYGFEVRDLIVPASRLFEIHPAHAHMTSPLYQFPFQALAELTLVVNLSGMAMRFCELVHEEVSNLSGERKIYFDRCREAAMTTFDAHRGHFYALADTAWAQVVEGRLVDEGEIRRTVVDFAQHLRQLVFDLFPFTGLKGTDTTREINRVWRNFQTASQHSLLRAI